MKYYYNFPLLIHPPHWAYLSLDISNILHDSKAHVFCPSVDFLLKQPPSILPSHLHLLFNWSQLENYSALVLLSPLPDLTNWSPEIPSITLVLAGKLAEGSESRHGANRCRSALIHLWQLCGLSGVFPFSQGWLPHWQHGSLWGQMIRTHFEGWPSLLYNTCYQLLLIWCNLMFWYPYTLESNESG